jgi:methylenetetrahydrofolate dehydrogenase (NADP+)/methenyltetrahydrofolate cyclohydrolase
MQTLDGKKVAESRRQAIKDQVDQFRRRYGRAPGLAVILVGDDPASQVYVGGKIKACAQTGLASFEHRLPAVVTAVELRALIERLNADPVVDGILLQLPLPASLPADEAINWISPAKDADCLTSENLGRLWSGRALSKPCTPWGVMVILEHYGIDPRGMNAVVVGRSGIVGKPMAHLLVEADATVTVCHSKTRDLGAFTRNAELVVVAAGRRGLLGAGDFAKGSVVIDVGIHRQMGEDGKTRLSGDVRLEEVADVVRAATPVPGGVGPMTITMLMENTLRLAEVRMAALKSPTPN